MPPFSHQPGEGPNQTGSLRRVQVKRGERVVTTLDLYDFLSKGDKSADVRLQDGDTIVIATGAPITGEYAAFGEQMKTGAEQAVKDINEFANELKKPDGKAEANPGALTSNSLQVSQTGDMAAGQVEFYRDADNGSDTLAADAKLLGVKLNITTNAADDS